MAKKYKAKVSKALFASIIKNMFDEGLAFLPTAIGESEGKRDDTPETRELFAARAEYVNATFRDTLPGLLRGICEAVRAENAEDFHLEDINAYDELTREFKIEAAKSDVTTLFVDVIDEMGEFQTTALALFEKYVPLIVEELWPRISGETP